ncbi:MAG: HipA N-terminal domain-containing protein [Chloroherpetonaceae bacterium]|nr:HipA N-terminal domain-containing protein [Chloroherpetonaceae bacterium]
MSDRIKPRKAAVYFRDDFAGILSETANGFSFRYLDLYYFDSSKQAISLTLPKNQQEYQSTILFPFFISLCSEGANLKRQLLYAAVEETDFFGLLLATAGYDTIGAVTISPFEKDISVTF